jgi:hypothetical protein
MLISFFHLFNTYYLKRGRKNNTPPAYPQPVIITVGQSFYIGAIGKKSQCFNRIIDRALNFSAFYLPELSQGFWSPSDLLHGLILNLYYKFVN